MEEVRYGVWVAFWICVLGIESSQVSDIRFFFYLLGNKMRPAHYNNFHSDSRMRDMGNYQSHHFRRGNEREHSERTVPRYAEDNNKQEKERGESEHRSRLRFCLPFLFATPASATTQKTYPPPFRETITTTMEPILKSSGQEAQQTGSPIARPWKM